MNNIYADVTELEEIAKSGQEELVEFKHTLWELKNEVKLLDDLKSPKYLETVSNELEDFIKNVDSELIENLTDIYKALNMVASEFENLDQELKGEL